MFFAGLASGFADAQSKDRALQAQIDENTAKRENDTLMHLSQIPGDDNADIRAHAVAAMLNPARKPGGFMASLTNQNKTNPALPTIRNLMQQGVSRPVMSAVQSEPGASTMAQGAQEPPASIAAPTGQPSAATPPPSEIDLPPQSMASVHNQLPQAQRTFAPVQTGTITTARHIPSGPEIAGQTEFQRTKGQVGGSMAGANDAFASMPQGAARRRLPGNPACEAWSLNPT